MHQRIKELKALGMDSYEIMQELKNQYDNYVLLRHTIYKEMN